MNNHWLIPITISLVASLICWISKKLFDRNDSQINSNISVNGDCNKIDNKIGNNYDR